MSQDALHHGRVFNQRHQAQPPAAARARQDVESERPPHQLGPLIGTEIEHLTWNDLNFDLGIVFIQAKPEVGWQPKTDERVIPISPTVQQLSFEQYANRTSDQWAFANSAGQRDGHILEKLKNVCRRAGIKPATVSYRFYNARIAVDASPAVAPCTTLHARSSGRPRVVCRHGTRLDAHRTGIEA